MKVAVLTGGTNVQHIINGNFTLYMLVRGCPASKLYAAEMDNSRLAGVTAATGHSTTGIIKGVDELPSIVSFISKLNCQSHIYQWNSIISNFGLQLLLRVC